MSLDVVPKFHIRLLHRLETFCAFTTSTVVQSNLVNSDSRGPENLFELKLKEVQINESYLSTRSFAGTPASVRMNRELQF